MIYGAIPAAGLGKRLQPLAFSKELAFVGGKSVIEYLLERMVIGGVDKIFIVVDPDKLDIPRYLSTKTEYADKLMFIVKNRCSLPDDLLYVERFLKPNDEIVFGLPDTIWYPKDGFKKIINFKKGHLVLGLFDSKEPEKFGIVFTDKGNKILKIEDKQEQPKTNWVWGIGKFPVIVARQMLEIHNNRQSENEKVLGDCMNIFVKNNPSYAVKLNNSGYLDIGRREDYQKAENFIKEREK